MHVYYQSFAQRAGKLPIWSLTAERGAEHAGARDMPGMAPKCGRGELRPPANVSGPRYGFRALGERPYRRPNADEINRPSGCDTGDRTPTNPTARSDQPPACPPVRSAIPCPLRLLRNSPNKLTSILV